MLYDGSSSGVESSQGESCGADWCAAGGRIKGTEGLVDSGTGITKVHDFLLTQIVRRHLMRKENDTSR